MSTHRRAPTLNEILNLRLSVLEQHALFSNRTLAKRAVYRDYKNALEQAKKTGIVESFFKNEKLRAALLVSGKPIFYHAKPYFVAKLLLQGNDAEALLWMRSALQKHRRSFKNILVLLDQKNHELLPDLSKLNANIQLAVFAGNPKLARKRLIEHYGTLSWRDHPDLKIRFLSTDSQIKDVIAIMKSEFKRNPRYGWMIASREFLLNEKKMLTRQRRRRKKSNYLIFKEGKVLGHFGFEVSQGDPFGLRSASMTLNFSKAIQKQGLAKLAYHTLLERMCELKIENFIGATSQEAVLKLNQIMKRPLVAYMLKTGEPYFETKYFMSVSSSRKSSSK